MSKRRRHKGPQLLTAAAPASAPARAPRPAHMTVVTAAAEPLTLDQQTRELAGMFVPFGPVGYSSMGPITFARGDIRLPAQLGRVKLLRQHKAEDSLGYVAQVTEADHAMFGRAVVAPGPEGDRALAEAGDGRRDGFSVGVQLDDDVIEELVGKWMDGDTSPTAARGELVEVSQVSLPAFTDARIDGSEALAAAFRTEQLLVHFAQPTAPPSTTPPAPAAGNHRKDPHGMFTAAQLAALAAAGVDPTNTDAAWAYLRTLGLSSAPASVTAPPAPAAPAPAAAPPANNAGVPSSTPGGPAVVVAEAPVYTFDGTGPSLIRDAYRLKVDGEVEAATRFARFNARMAANDPGQLRVLTAAVETRATAPNFINQGYRPDLLVEAIDRKRPLISRIGTVPITDATPFRVPVEGDFHRETTVADGATTSGSVTVTSATAAFTAEDLGVAVTATGIPAGAIIVKVNSGTSVNLNVKATATASGLTLKVKRFGTGDHTEGTAHVAEGDLDVGETLLTPGAISGAYRLSRELIDATNPALDRIALRAMTRDYGGKTERKVAAMLVTAAGTPVATINTVLKLRQELNNFYDATDEDAELVAASTSYYTTLLGDVDTTGRPMLASINPENAVGQVRPGFTGASIDNAELFKTTRIPGDTGLILNPEDVLVGESSTRTFRFEEVEGPGVVKLAIWGYLVAGVLRTYAVRAVTSV